MSSLGLDLEGGSNLARLEMYGDWYRDPWGWPELTQVSASSIDAERDLNLKKNGREFGLGHQPYFHLIEVPKTRLGLRPAVVQDPLSRLAYLSSVHAGLNELHSGLSPKVYGWRKRDGDGVEKGGAEWANYVGTLPTNDQDGYGLVTDITSFFASVRPERLEPIVYRKLGKVASARVIMDIVQAHDSLSTRSGLPQRSFASAILAHTVLQPIDDALTASLMDGRITNVRRWMDDISAEGDEEALFALLVDLQERARQTGLELNASKTWLSPVAEAAATLRLEDLKEINVPLQYFITAYDEEVQEEPDLDALLRLECAVLENPGHTPRPITKAVLVSLTSNQQFDRQAEWRNISTSLPHVADALGRYLRGAVEYDNSLLAELGQWFSAYQASTWGRLNWVTAQFSLIFSADSMPVEVLGVLRGWLEYSVDIQQVAIAVQRICVTHPVLGRNLVRARVDRTADPLLLRIFALGLLMAGETRTTVEAVLARDPRNHLLLKLLHEKQWDPPQVARDFDFSPTSDHE